IWESLRVGLGTFRAPGSGMLSFFGGLALCGLSIAQICKGWKVREGTGTHSPRVLFALLSLFVYSLLLDTLGFVISTFFLVGVLFHLGQPRRWWLLIGMSALVTFLTYLIFGVLLSVYFPRGFLGI
ncbi:MAG: tripartite tricarboxylate transporter TctB family protein, partial [Pseudomonadota bacterium]